MGDELLTAKEASKLYKNAALSEVLRHIKYVAQEGGSLIQQNDVGGDVRLYHEIHQCKAELDSLGYAVEHFPSNTGVRAHTFYTIRW